MVRADNDAPSWAVPPDSLPAGAIDLWPNISRWPTPATIADLLSSRETRPADFQSVVNGLRWHSTGDLSSAWSLVTAWLAVVAILLAALAEPLGGWALWTSMGLAAGFTVMLLRIGAIAAEHADRKRHASLWLAAVEAAPPRRRMFGRT